MTEKELYNQLEEYDKEVNRLYKENKQLKKNIDKSIKFTEELYNMTKEQDSDNVNLIDRLEIILKTLKGEEND